MWAHRTGPGVRRREKKRGIKFNSPQLQKSVHKASDINVQFTEAVAHHAAPGAPAKFTLREAHRLKATAKWGKWSSVESGPKKKKKNNPENRKCTFV